MPLPRRRARSQKLGNRAHRRNHVLRAGTPSNHDSALRLYHWKRELTGSEQEGGDVGSDQAFAVRVVMIVHTKYLGLGRKQVVESTMRDDRLIPGTPSTRWTVLQSLVAQAGRVGKNSFSSSISPPSERVTLRSGVDIVRYDLIFHAETSYGHLRTHGGDGPVSIGDERKMTTNTTTWVTLAYCAPPRPKCTTLTHCFCAERQLRPSMLSGGLLCYPTCTQHLVSCTI